MTIKLISKPLVLQKKNELKERVKTLISKGVTPYLKVILVGNHPASVIYTRNKKKFIENIGGKCDIIELPNNIIPKDFIGKINTIIHDPLIHGCLVQIPLPSHLSHINIAKIIPPHIDVDGFHANNLFNIISGDKGEKTLIPCTPKGIMELINFYKIPIESKNVVVIGRSLIVGKPMSLLLQNYHATVTMVHSYSSNVQEITKNADIIITAVGSPKFFDKKYFKDDQSQYIIDVGMNKDINGKLCGDVDYENVYPNVAGITPVPGGVGPMTILSLAQNLLQSAELSV